MFFNHKFLVDQFALGFNILKNKKYANSCSVYLYNKYIIKLFYGLYLIRHLTLFFITSVLDFEINIYFVNLISIFKEIKEFLDKCDVLYLENRIIFLYMLDDLLNFNICKIRYILDIFNIGGSFVSSRFELNSIEAYENHCRVCSLGFVTHLSNSFFFIKEIGLSDQLVSVHQQDYDLKLSNKNDIMFKLLDLYNKADILLNDHYLFILKVNKFDSNIIEFFMDAFNFYYEILLYRLFFNYIDYDYFINIVYEFDLLYGRLDFNDLSSVKNCINFLFNHIIKEMFLFFKVTVSFIIYNRTRLSFVDFNYSDSLGLKEHLPLLSNFKLYMDVLLFCKNNTMDLYCFNLMNLLIAINRLYLLVGFNEVYLSYDIYLLAKLSDMCLYLFNVYKTKKEMYFILFYKVYRKIVFYYFKAFYKLPLSRNIFAIINDQLNINIITFKLDRFFYFKELLCFNYKFFYDNFNGFDLGYENVFVNMFIDVDIFYVFLDNFVIFLESIIFKFKSNNQKLIFTHIVYLFIYNFFFELNSLRFVLLKEIDIILLQKSLINNILLYSEVVFLKILESIVLNIKLLKVFFKDV